MLVVVAACTAAAISTVAPVAVLSYDIEDAILSRDGGWAHVYNGIITAVRTSSVGTNVGTFRLTAQAVPDGRFAVPSSQPCIAGADMNQDLTASTRQSRSILTVVAVPMSLLVLGSIDALSQHYRAESQMASARPVVMAQR